MGCVPPPPPKIILTSSKFEEGIRKAQEKLNDFRLENGTMLTLPLGWSYEAIKIKIPKCEYCKSEKPNEDNCKNCGAS